VSDEAAIAKPHDVRGAESIDSGAKKKVNLQLAAKQMMMFDADIAMSIWQA